MVARPLAVVTLALIGGLGWAAAQPVSDSADATLVDPGSIGETTSADFKLSVAQKSAIFHAVHGDAAKATPSATDFRVSLGAPVPPSIELHALPDGALVAVPAAGPYRYTLVQNQVVLIDPTTLRVVDIIRQ
jgi:hypothetical protein